MLLCYSKKQKGKGSLARDNPDKPTICAFDSSNHSEVAALARRIPSLLEIRKQKVLDIRRQLKEKTYDLDKHLDASLSKILDDIRK